MAEGKRSFMFPNREAIPPVEHRVAYALESIAHYLDRIEGHLEQLVKTVDANGGGFPLVQAELAQIRLAIGAAAARLDPNAPGRR